MSKQKLLAAGIVALACFGFFVMVLPMYHDITQTREDLATHEAVLKERTELASKVTQLNGDYQKYADQISKLDKLIPEKKQADQIVFSLQEISNQSGLNMTEISVADLSNTGGSSNYKSSIINLQLSGNYTQFGNFMKLTEQSLRLYDINDITISTSTGTQQRGALNFQLKIYTNNIN